MIARALQVLPGLITYENEAIRSASAFFLDSEGDDAKVIYGEPDDEASSSYKDVSETTLSRRLIFIFFSGCFDGYVVFLTDRKGRRRGSAQWSLALLTPIPWSRVQEPRHDEKEQTQREFVDMRSSTNGVIYRTRRKSRQISKKT